MHHFFSRHNVISVFLTILTCFLFIFAFAASNTTIGPNISTTGTLSVTSTTTFNGISYGWPSADGTNGQMLTTSGAGVLSWSAVSTTTAGGWTDLSSYVILASTTKYVGIGTTTPSQKLHLYDGTLLVDNPVNPSLTGTHDTSGNAYDVYVSGKYAYVADGTYGLQIIDISNPSSPTSIGTYDTSGSAWGIYISGKYAYVADETAGLQIIDISNSTNPTLVGAYATGFSLSFGVYVSGKYAYVADGGSGLRIIDISDQSSPISVGQYNTPQTANDIYISGKYAYVADGSSGLQIIDISNPVSPILAGSYDTTNAQGVYISGNYAYVADGISGVQIINISNPSLPTLVGNYDTAETMNDVYVSGKYIYGVAFGGLSPSKLMIINISDPSFPTLVGTYNSLSGANGIYVSGKYAYVADGNYGLQIIDLKGADIHALNAGNINSNNITVTENMDIGNNLYVRNGVNIGIGGMHSNGPSSIGIFATTSLSSIPALSLSTTDGNNSSIVDILNLTHMASSTSASGIGTGLLFSVEDSTGVSTTTARISSSLYDVTNGTSTLSFYTKPDNTGLYERMRITDTGYVGIGTTSPYAMLSVAGPTVSQYFHATSTTATSTFSGGLVAGPIVGFASASGLTVLQNSLVGINTSSPSASLTIKSLPEESSTNPFRIFDTGANTVFVATNGNNSYNVGVATSTPWRKFSVTGTVGFEGLTTTAPDESALCLSANKEVTVNTGVTTCGASSQRYKYDIKDLDIGLDTLNSLHPVSYKYKSTNQPHIGLIAEEVNEIEPRLVATGEDGLPKSVRYDELTALIIKSVQELSSTIKDNIIKVKDLIVDTLTAKKITTDQLELRDQSTSEMWCVRMVDGELEKIRGECEK